jgi:hypothetical protein
MAVKTFTNEQLTASDTNTYLANSGLVVVTPSSVTGATLSGAKITINTAQSTVTVSGVFSATYDSYRIVIAGSAASGDGNNVYYKQSGSTGSTYNANGFYMGIGSSTVSGFNNSSSSAGVHVALTGTTFWSSSFDVHNPFLTTRTTLVAQGAGSGYFTTSGGYDSNAASSTGFTLTLSAGTITGGTITVFGYRVG